MEKRPEFIRRGTEGGPKNRRPGDWDCGRCGNMNYARRDTCNKCPVGFAIVCVLDASSIHTG